MPQPYECARCRGQYAGRRLIIEQSATDELGVSIVVEKCWTLCPPCAEDVMALVGEVSPWQSDARTMVLPDDLDEPSVRLLTLRR